MNADGSNTVNLTNNPGNDMSPEWSPDGTKIAFVSDGTGTSLQYTMNTDGTNVAMLSGNEASNNNSAWQPVPTTDVDVAVDDGGFYPDAISVNQGDTLRWDFSGSSDHNVTDRSGLGVFGSGSEPPGGAYAAQ